MVQQQAATNGVQVALATTRVERNAAGKTNRKDSVMRAHAGSGRKRYSVRARAVRGGRQVTRQAVAGRWCSGGSAEQREEGEEGGRVSAGRQQWENKPCSPVNATRQGIKYKRKQQTAGVNCGVAGKEPQAGIRGRWHLNNVGYRYNGEQIRICNGKWYEHQNR